MGDAEAELRKAFSLARQASPCILFVDELDGIVTNRESTASSSSRVEGRILATFLTEMDGIGGMASGGGVIVMGATNRVDVIDAALTRKGRFHHVLYVGPPPDHDTRMRLLLYYAEKSGLAEDDHCMLKLEEELRRREANIGEDFIISGADIESMCREKIMEILKPR